MLTTEKQKERLEQIDNCQLSLIALSEKNTYIESFKLGVKMTTEIYADIQQRWDHRNLTAVRLYYTSVGTFFLLPTNDSNHKSKRSTADL